jgi:hypothetical protein
MGFGHIGAALAGALITVLVYQFLVLPRVQARPAQPEKSASPVATDKPTTPAPAPTAAATPPAPDAAGRIAAKEQEIARLQKELGDLRDQAATAAKGPEPEGKARAWPQNLPQGYKPDVMEARLNALLEKSGLGELVDFDCEEFPCVAVIEAKEGTAGDEWTKKLQGALSELARTPDLGGRVSMAMTGSQRRDGDKLSQTNAVALVPADMFDAELQKRTNSRAQLNLEKGRK